MYVYILYMRCQDAILVIVCTGQRITISLADEWLNIFHCDIKYITANGYMINVGTNYICHVTITHSAQKWEVPGHLL